MTTLIELFKPKNQLELLIIQDSEFIVGAEYGKPRPGHPEGEVKYHIRDVLTNIDNYAQEEQREKLRIIALGHDTFKYKINPNLPRTGENHHGTLARRFMEKYTQDQDILDITELHDEAYNSWKMGERKVKWEEAKQRALKLLTRLDQRTGLYLVFFKCDNATRDKNPASYLWFKELASRTTN